MSTPRHAVLVFTLAALIGSPVSGQSSASRLPSGGRVTIDGRLDDAEWSAARNVEYPGGTTVRLMRDEAHVYIGITSSRPGFASLCLASGSDVHVLHASAALGAITYRRQGDTWNSADTAFVYGMRNRAVDDAAHRERASYLARHGWVASTVSMNDGRAQEMQIALSRFPLPVSLALGRFLLPDGVEHWPSTADAADGCFVQRLVSGYVPQGLRFDVSRWLRIDP